MKDINNIEIEVGDLIHALYKEETAYSKDYYAIVRKVTDREAEGEFIPNLDYKQIIKYTENSRWSGAVDAFRFDIKIIKKGFYKNQFITE